MRIQMLPSTIDENGRASVRQHLLSIIIDDAVAIDAGSLAFSCTNKQRQQVRDAWIAGRRKLADRVLVDMDMPSVLARAAGWRARIAAVRPGG